MPASKNAVSPAMTSIYGWTRSVLPYAILLAVGFLLFPAAGRDDKYVTFWPAYTLAELGEMVNYNGQRVEQSSSLLLVLLLAALRALSGWPLLWLGYGASIAAGVFAVGMAGRVGARLSQPIGYLAMLLTATNTYFVYWTFGSMEAPLVGLCALGFLYALQSALFGDMLGSAAKSPRLLAYGLATAAYLLVRPESPLVVASVLFFVTVLCWISSWRDRHGPIAGSAASATPSWVSLGRLWAIAIALGLALVGFRLAYFGSPFPQPVAAKAGHSGWSTWVWSIKCGLTYLAESPLAFPLALAAFVGALRFALDARTRVDFVRAPIVGFVLAYGGYLVLSGGGWMEGSRMSAHVLPVAAVLVGDGLFRTFGSGSRLRTVACGLLALQVAGSLYFAATQSISLPLWSALSVQDLGTRHFTWIERANREHRRDSAVIEVLDDLLKRLPTRPLSERPAVLSHNVGMIMFYLQRDHPNRMSTIDLHGLSDRYVTDSAYRDRLSSWALGLRWNHGTFLEDYAKFAPETGVPRPAFLFWNNGQPHGGDDWAVKLGYHTYLAQRGRMSPSSTDTFHGVAFEANQFWSVRDDIAKALQLPEDALYLDMPRAEQVGLRAALERRSGEL